MSQSLGLLEVAGLLPAVTVADALVKTANVRLLAVEAAKGNGWMTVKIEGSVDAVNAAIDAGVAIAKEMSVLISKKVIARPDEAIFQMFVPKQEVENAEYESSISADVMGQDVEKAKTKNTQIVEPQNKEITDHIVEEIDSADDEIPEVEIRNIEGADHVVEEVNFLNKEVLEVEFQAEEVTEHLVEEASMTDGEIPEAELQNEEKTDYIDQQIDDVIKATCNLCLDPRCTRKKGEFKTSCLHYIK